jgi:hypothetical protein
MAGHPTAISNADVESDTPSRHPSQLAVIGGVLIAVWLAVIVARLLHAEPLQSANDRSRWCTVWSLVEEGTYRIDTIRQRSGWDTIDKVRHDGHFYSSKPPLLATLVAGLYWLEKQTIGWDLIEETAATSRVLLLVVNILPMLVALALFGRLIAKLTASPFVFTFVMAAACFGTLLNPFLISLNNHTPGAISVFFTICATAAILTSANRRGWLFAMAGFWAACASCMELPAAALGVASFVLLFLTDRRRTLLWFVPAALLPLGAFFYTNYLATGGIKPFYSYYGTEKYEYVHNGVPSYWMNPRGIDQARDCPLVYFMHCTIGHHGVFSLSPIFLLTLISWVRPGNWRTSPLWPLHAMGLGLTVVVFGFFMTRTENYNYGGVSVALRWLLWLVPFWLLAIVPLLEARQPGRWGRGLCLVLLCASTFSAWYPLNGPWKHPWLFNVMTDAGWIDYSDPAPPKLSPFRTWIRTVPATDDDAPVADYWVEFSGLDGNGQLVRLRLADAGGVEVEGRRGRTIAVTQTPEEGEPVERRLSIDATALAANAPVGQVLLWPDGEPTDEERAWAEEFLRGLPSARPYSPGKLRYVSSPLRTEAFQTRHAASRVLATPRDHPRPTIYRRDVWTTDDVPFGAVEFRIMIQDARSGDLVRQSTMRAVAAGRVAEFDPESLIFE